MQESSSKSHIVISICTTLITCITTIGWTIGYVKDIENVGENNTKQIEELEGAFYTTIGDMNKKLENIYAKVNDTSINVKELQTILKFSNVRITQ